MAVPLIPLIWGGIGLAGGYLGYKTLDEAGQAAEAAGEAAEKSTDLAKWLVLGGGLYVSYRAMKSAGVIK